MEQAMIGMEANTRERTRSPVVPINREQLGELASQSAGIIPLWMTEDELCDYLDIAPVALDALVVSGAVTRLVTGSGRRYRFVRGQQPVDNETTRVRPSRQGVANQPPAEEYLSALVGLVDRLAERLSSAERVLDDVRTQRDLAIDVAVKFRDESRALLTEVQATTNGLKQAVGLLKKRRLRTRRPTLGATDPIPPLRRFSAPHLRSPRTDQAPAPAPRLPGVRAPRIAL